MAEKDRREEAGEETRREADELADRFPRMPSAPDLPEPPKLSPTLPPSAQRQPGAVEPGGYNKMALAFTAANSFIMPVIVLTIAGIFLDRKFGGGKGWYVILGVFLGLIVGVTALVRVIKKMSDEK
jgi:hypothetical protein